MRILVVKISSMGDVIHTLPAITDLANNCLALVQTIKKMTEDNIRQLNLMDAFVLDYAEEVGKIVNESPINIIQRIKSRGIDQTLTKSILFVVK